METASKLRVLTDSGADAWERMLDQAVDSVLSMAKRNLSFSFIIQKCGDPSQVAWRSGQPVTYRNRSHIPWCGRCPAGHLTDQALETNQVVGWVCEQCQKVYDAREWGVVSRGDVGQ
jgi:hypothetical protein